MATLIDEKLVEQYSAEQALGYDRRREVTPRYAQEVAVFSRLLAAIAPETVIDCPFGTGRWLERYLAAGARVVGIDASADMLEIARAKPGASSRQVSMLQGSIFDQALFSQFGAPGVDLAVCVRFANWISLPELEQAVASLGAARPRHLVLGVSVRPRDWSLWKRAQARVQLWRHNRRLLAQGKPIHHVHDEQAVLELLSRAGWCVVSDDVIFTDPVRVNRFLHLVRQVPAGGATPPAIRA